MCNLTIDDVMRCRGRGRRSGSMVVAARWLRINRITHKKKKEQKLASVS